VIVHYEKGWKAFIDGEEVNYAQPAQIVKRHSPDLENKRFRLPRSPGKKLRPVQSLLKKPFSDLKSSMPKG
jgi:hypothetical protein